MLTPEYDAAVEPVPAAEPPVEERRAAARCPSGQDAVCHPAAGAAAMPAHVLDVSPRGVGLLVQRRFEPGTLLVLELAGAARRPVSVLARVVRLAARSDGWWLVGCTFFGEVDEEELRAFRAQPDVAAEVRSPAGQMAVCRRDSPGWIGRWTAEIRDVSVRGVGLLLPAEVEVGARLRIEVVAEGEPPPVTVVRVVRRERQDDGRWLVGCELC